MFLCVTRCHIAWHCKYCCHSFRITSVETISYTIASQIVTYSVESYFPFLIKSAYTQDLHCTFPLCHPTTPCIKIIGCVDKIHPYLASIAAFEIFHPITYIINLSLKQCIYPDNLKIAKVIPIFKQGSRDSCDNYRPISVLPVLSKILEKCIYNQLMYYITIENVITLFNMALCQVVQQ